MTMQMIRSLSAALPLLNEADRRFASSLLDGAAKHAGTFTDKQAFWVNKLIARASTGGVDPTVTETVGDLAGVYGLFATAKAHLKFPAIVLGYTRGHEQRELRISVSTERSSTPGWLQVKDDDDGTWYGRISPAGVFEHSRRNAPPSGLNHVLTAFAADPAKVASEHGHLTGKCCFCNKKLTDERSTAVGYGKTCADHFGMPWGAKAAKARAVTAALVPWDANGATGVQLAELEGWEPDMAGEEEYDRAEARAVAGAWSAF